MWRPSVKLITSLPDTRKMDMKKITDWSTVIAAVATAIGVWFAYAALQNTVHWNRLSGQYIFFSSQVLMEKEQTAAAGMEKLGINLHTQKVPLPTNVVEMVLTNNAVLAPVKSYLNFFEDYSLAVRSGVLDEENSYALMGGKIIRKYEVFEPFVAAIRVKLESKTVLEEWEHLAQKWKLRRLSEKQLRDTIHQESQDEYVRKLRKMEEEIRKRLRKYE